MNQTKLNVKLLRWTPEPEALVAIAAKLCYSSAQIADLIEKQTPKSVEKFIKILTDMGHESPTEHVSLSFAIEGVSRSLTHQLVRHRIGMSYSQQSQRYVRELQFEYIIPEEIEKIPHLRERFIEEMRRDQEAYDYFVDELMAEYCFKFITNKHKGAYDESIHDDHEYMFDEVKRIDKKEYGAFEKKAIENARYVFPNAAETKILVTGNARSLDHFFNERCCMRAQDEIRHLAYEMLVQSKKLAPTLFANSGPKCYKHKMCPESSMSCGKFPTYEEVLEVYDEYTAIPF